MRLRGSSLCDIVVVVVDITRGLEKQMIESLDLLKHRNVRFIVALNNVAICVFLIVLQYNYNLFYFNHHEL